MKSILAAIAYMVIGGLLAAVLINSRAKFCGPTPVKDEELFFIAVAWPAFIAAAVATEDSASSKERCAATDMGPAK